MSAFLKYRAQQTSYIAILYTTKILLLPRFLKCTFPLPALTETCFEVSTLGEFAPGRSVFSAGEDIEGGDILAAPATSYSRDLIEYMTADACSTNACIGHDLRFYVQEKKWFNNKQYAKKFWFYLY